MEIDKSYEQELSNEINKQIDLQTRIKLAIKTCDQNSSDANMKKDLIYLIDSLSILEDNVYAIYCFKNNQVKFFVFF